MNVRLIVGVAALPAAGVAAWLGFAAVHIFYGCALTFGGSECSPEPWLDAVTAGVALVLAAPLLALSGLALFGRGSRIAPLVGAAVVFDVVVGFCAFSGMSGTDGVAGLAAGGGVGLVVGGFAAVKILRSG